MLVAVRVIERQHRQPWRLTAVEELDGLYAVPVIHGCEDRVAIRNGIVQTLHEVGLRGLAVLEAALRRLLASGDRADAEVCVGDVADDLTEAPHGRCGPERVQVFG